MKKIKLASIGDCCVDIYKKYNKIFPGGTALNVAAHARDAGAETSILSAVGTDSNAIGLQKSFKKFEIDISHLAIINGKTSQIDVRLDEEGKPTFSHWDLGVLKNYLLKKTDKEFLQKQDAIRIALLKPMAELFEQFCSLGMPNVLKVADFAGSSMYSQGIKIIDKYIANFDVIVKSIDKQDEKSLSFLKQLAADYKHKIILVLLGKNGSLIFTNGKTYKQSAYKTHVIDTSGAGDAYLAHFLVNYLKTNNIPEAMQKGARAAATVVGHLGTVSA